jgi:hypothetical protein
MKKKKKGKPYHLALNIEGEPVVIEVKKFSDWFKNRNKNQIKEEPKTEIYESNIYQRLSDLVFDNIKESVNYDETINFQAEFVLSELKSIQPQKEIKYPFKSEDWLGTNPKTDKTELNLDSLKADDSFGYAESGKNIEFKSFIINLLPAKQSGFNMCMCASKACAATCLHTSGNIGGLVDKTVSRLRKSWAMVFDREKAIDQIVKQIHREQERINRFNKLRAGTWVEVKNTDNLVQEDDISKKGNKYVRKSNPKTEIRKKPKNTVAKLVVRLNGTSDLVWKNIKDSNGKNLFQEFPDVIFYDYTKDPHEMKEFLNQPDFPNNYHLTASYNGSWSRPINTTLMNKGNVAVAFGPGKTSGLDYMSFPSNMEDLLKNLKYPESVKNKKQYNQEILNYLRSQGVYCESGDLAPFANKTLLPGLFHCYEVIDGDHYDARFIDDHLNKHDIEEKDVEISNKIHPKDFDHKQYGLIVGLVAKGALSFTSYDTQGEYGWNPSASGFMVGPQDKGLDQCDALYINDEKKSEYLIKKTDIYKKVATAIMLIRNHDARHLESGERTHLPTTGKQVPMQTYPTAKNRVDQEINDLSSVFHKILDNKPLPKGIEVKSTVIQAFEKLKNYIKNPQVMEKLRDPNFIRSAEEAGIGIDFNSLLKYLEDEKYGYVDPVGERSKASLTLLPHSVVKPLTTTESFSNWLFEKEIIENLRMLEGLHAI